VPAGVLMALSGPFDRRKRIEHEAGFAISFDAAARIPCA
jgi:hypothetical protein